MLAATPPVCALFCVQPQRGASDLQQGGSIFPAVQKLPPGGSRARARCRHYSVARLVRGRLAYVGRHSRRLADRDVDHRGWPRGGHHPVRRKPIEDVVAIDAWNQRWERCS